MLSEESLKTTIDWQLAWRHIGHIVQLLVTVSFFLSTAFATSVSQAADAVAGKRLYPVCTACHGAAGQGNRGMGGPKLAGQQGIYLLKQLQNFQSGARGMSPGDAKGRQMAAMSKGPALSSAWLWRIWLPIWRPCPTAINTVNDVARGENLMPPALAATVKWLKALK